MSKEEFKLSEIASMYHKLPSIGFKLRYPKRFQISLQSIDDFERVIQFFTEMGIIKKGGKVVSELNDTDRHNEVTLSETVQFSNPQDVIYNIPSSSYYDQYKKKNPNQHPRDTQRITQTHVISNHSGKVPTRVNKLFFPSFSQPTQAVSQLSYDQEQLQSLSFNESAEYSMDQENAESSMISQCQSQLLALPSHSQSYNDYTPSLSQTRVHALPMSQLPRQSQQLSNRSQNHLCYQSEQLNPSEETYLNNEFLSQVLNEPSSQLQQFIKNNNENGYNNLSDEQIKEVLKTKIKDMSFIKFVERIEDCLKDLR